MALGLRKVPSGAIGTMGEPSMDTLGKLMPRDAVGMPGGTPPGGMGAMG